MSVAATAAAKDETRPRGLGQDSKDGDRVMYVPNVSSLVLSPTLTIHAEPCCILQLLLVQEQETSLRSSVI